MAASFLLLLYTVVIKIVISQSWGYNCLYKQSSSSSFLNLCHYPQNGMVIEATNSQDHYLYTPANLSFYSSDSKSRYSVIRINNNDETNITYLVSSVSVRPTIVTSQPILTFQFEHSITNPLCP
eukprot:1004227_1